MEWFCERRSTGVRYIAETWEGLGLDHDDVTKPGRIKYLGFKLANSQQFIVELEESEVLHLVVRHRLSTRDGSNGTERLVLGIKREDESGVFWHIFPDGNVTMKSTANS